jgi:membrane complex biogenesis BtpA family protein
MKLLATRKPFVGMIHLAPLAGSVAYTRQGTEPILDLALRDLEALEEGGVDAILVENLGDTPFAKAALVETVAMMTAVVVRLVDAARLPLGVNVLRNDGAAALAIAAATGASFVRVNVFAGVAFTDQGMIEGAARELLKLRRDLGADIDILADVHVKHAAHLTRLEQAAVDIDRNRPDALIVTGMGTGFHATASDVETVKAVSDRPVFVGSGITAETAAEYRRADGFIVGTALKKGGRVEAPVDVGRVRAVAAAIAALRTSR